MIPLAVVWFDVAMSHALFKWLIWNTHISRQKTQSQMPSQEVSDNRTKEHIGVGTKCQTKHAKLTATSSSKQTGIFPDNQQGANLIRRERLIIALLFGYVNYSGQTLLLMDSHLGHYSLSSYLTNQITQVRRLWEVYHLHNQHLNSNKPRLKQTAALCITPTDTGNPMQNWSECS